MSGMRCADYLFVDWLRVLQIWKKIMQWETHHTYSDRIAGKLYPEHYGDMIYHGLQEGRKMREKMRERRRQTDTHTDTNTSVATVRTQWTNFYPMPLHLTFVLLLFQYAWDTNEDYLFKAMVAFSVRRVPNREATE